MHSERTNRHKADDQVQDGAVPAYLLDREQTARAKVLSFFITVVCHFPTVIFVCCELLLARCLCRVIIFSFRAPYLIEVLTVQCESFVSLKRFTWLCRFSAIRLNRNVKRKLANGRCPFPRWSNLWPLIVLNLLLQSLIFSSYFADCVSSFEGFLILWRCSLSPIAVMIFIMNNVLTEYVSCCAGAPHCWRWDVPCAEDGKKKEWVLSLSSYILIDFVSLI